PQVWDPHAASHVRALLAVVGERVAALVDESRRPDDVPDERRGHVFPLDLVIRDARDLAGVDSRLVISDADLSDDMTRWAMLCGLSDSELGTLIVAAAVHVDPRFEAFFIVLNNEVDTRAPSTRCSASNLTTYASGYFTPTRRFDGRVDNLLSWRSEPLIPGELLPDTGPFPDVPPLGSRHESAIVCMRSHQGSGAVCIAHHRLHMSGHPRALMLDAHDLPHDTSECRDAVHASLREAALACTPMIVDARRIAADRVGEVITLLDQSFVPVIVITGPSVSVDLPPDRIVDVPVAAPAVRDAWLDYLTNQIDSPRPVDTLQRLEPEDIRERLLHGNEKISASAPSDMGTLARPVIPTFRLSHVIVPDQVEGELSHLLSRVRLRDRVFDDW
ncbi:MAG: hypothetical protein VW929_07775, partial [Actinomycetota bacterium]